MKRSYAISILLVLGLLAFSACTKPVATPSPTPTPTPTNTVSSCHADFFAEPTEAEGPAWVQFTDQSTGNITSWEWDFDDDGAIDSTEQNPRHYYSSDGSYSVTLIITGPDCEDRLTKDNYIEVYGCKT
ncbi:MAG: PKD domain-containing protein [Dehalococcoidia bacterium]|nr:MAG: PKD domain-containing protein [Dehalococcoidia bacterium]